MELILTTWGIILSALILLGIWYQGYSTRASIKRIWKRYEEDEKRKRALISARNRPKFI